MSLKAGLVGGLISLSYLSGSYASPGNSNLGFYQSPGKRSLLHQEQLNQPELTKPAEPSTKPSLDQMIDTYIKDLRQNRYLASTDQASIVVYDLAGDKTLVSLNADQPRIAASLIKPLVMLALYEAIEKGRVKETPAVRRDLTLMITYDRGCREANRATNRLLKVVGKEYANQVLRRYGFSRSKIRELIPGDGRTYRNTTSAGEVSTLLQRIYQQQLVNPRADREMLQLLKRSYSTRLRTPDMGNLEIANKTGYVYGMNGDAGIVFMKDKEGKERPYIVTVMIEDKSKPSARHRPVSWGRKRTKVIREVSGMVWERMKARG